MTKLEGRLPAVRIEVVTASFVASGVPSGIHSLSGFLETLNNPALSRYIELNDAAVRPLYRAQAAVDLDAPMLVRRDDVVFANFEGPYFTADAASAPATAAPVLLLAPPFQIAGSMRVPAEADATQALRAAVAGFFIVRDARVFDAEGNGLGQGDQIVVNGSVVQMTSPTRRRIETPARATQTRLAVDEDEPTLEMGEVARRAA